MQLGSTFMKPVPSPLSAQVRRIAPHDAHHRRDRSSVLRCKCTFADAAARRDAGLRQGNRRQIVAHYAHVEALYKDIHANPELAFEEVEHGEEARQGNARPGLRGHRRRRQDRVVAMLRNGAGPTVMVRTELDALPMEEKTGLPYASKVKTTYQGKETFVAHSCGHDLHMAAWVGTARTLVALKNRWQGTLMFVAQPAEEVLGGAKAMLAGRTVHPLPQARRRIRAAYLADGVWRDRLQFGPGDVQRRRLRDHFQGTRRARLGAGQVDRPSA